MTVIDETRLAKITTLDRGSHTSPRGKAPAGACVMEAVAWVTGAKWSDHPECVCPVIGAFMRNWNDNLPDDERTALLLPLIPKLVDTRGSAALADRRATMAADWLVRVQTPAWLRLAKLTDQAALLEGLPEVTNVSRFAPIKPVLDAVRKDASAARAAAGAAAGDAAWAAAGAAARAAAWAAARDAAWDAAWDAAGAAAGAAAGDAAWAAAGAAARAAAWAAAGAAAWDAARAAAWAAAGAAAGDALKDTKATIQQSAVALVERMCALTEADLGASQ